MHVCSRSRLSHALFFCLFFKKNLLVWARSFNTARKTFSIVWPFLVVFCWSLNLQTCQNPKRATNQNYWPWSIAQSFRVLSPSSSVGKEGTVVLLWNGKASHCKRMHEVCSLYGVRRTPSLQWMCFPSHVLPHHSSPAWIEQPVQQSLQFSGHSARWATQDTEREWAMPCLELWGNLSP